MTTINQDDVAALNARSLNAFMRLDLIKTW